MKTVLFPFHKTCNNLFKENEPKLCLGYHRYVSLAIDTRSLVQIKTLKPQAGDE